MLSVCMVLFIYLFFKYNDDVWVLFPTTQLVLVVHDDF